VSQGNLHLFLTTYHHPIPAFQRNCKKFVLLAVISQRSPDLQSLSLCFGTCELDGVDIVELFIEFLIPTLCTYLKTFKCLLSLSLTFITDWFWESRIDFLIHFTWKFMSTLLSQNPLEMRTLRVYIRV
jgi:hypothetical protein